MLRALSLLMMALLLTGCGIEADAPPYYNGTFVGSYLTSSDAAPVGMKLYVQASAIERKRYTITGNAMLGEESFIAEGYELASENLDYISSQAAPPPQGNAFIELKNADGATVYTLCSSIYYRDYSDNLRVDSLFLIEGSPQEEPAYCASSYRLGGEFAIVYLTRQTY